jgi:WD40 repeat protein
MILFFPFMILFSPFHDIIFWLSEQLSIFTIWSIFIVFDIRMITMMTTSKSVALPQGWHPMGLSYLDSSGHGRNVVSGGLLAVAASPNYGLRGKQGGVLLLSSPPKDGSNANDNPAREWRTLETSIMDVQVVSPDIVCAAGSNGCLYILNGHGAVLGRHCVHKGDINRISVSKTRPSHHNHDHSQHHSNGNDSDNIGHISTASWDGTVKVFDIAPSRNHQLNQLYALQLGHPVMETSWQPQPNHLQHHHHSPGLLACVGLDLPVQVFDCERRIHQTSQLSSYLSVDWNPSGAPLLACGGTNAQLSLVDLRRTGATPLQDDPWSPNNSTRLVGHLRSIRQVRWLGEHTLVSVGYDMSVRWWDLRALNPLHRTDSRFREFVVAVEPMHGQPESSSPSVAVACWDGRVYFL